MPTSHVAVGFAVFNQVCYCTHKTSRLGSVVKVFWKEIHLIFCGPTRRYHKCVLCVDRHSIRIAEVADALLKSSVLGRLHTVATGFI